MVMVRRGLIGAFAVFGSIISGPKIGLLSLVALVLAGQLLASLIYRSLWMARFSYSGIKLWAHFRLCAPSDSGNFNPQVLVDTLY